ncbi:hypothetical protein HPP92_021625 [Vanilla planifolia]|uniref:Myb/SANT-like DNA-binding domain-containing protein n=1 Tax=Vanilla planifolia TaxID=51239 RepID=A0A835UHD0_VANPL|nr:hypothetical protein HPP92_021625 [Vanilla planifolia]
MEGGGQQTGGLAWTRAGSDKGRRDEWSEGGVLLLLEVYESKWHLRNRAKLKGSDWEDIARQVSVRCSGTKVQKTPNQCKNKIESMKKRYRSEAAAAADHPNTSSTWQFFPRMDCLLKGSECLTSRKAANNHTSKCNVINLPVPMKAEEVHVDVEAENSDDSNRGDGSNSSAEKDNHHHQKDGPRIDTDVSAPRCECLGDCKNSKRKKGFGKEVAESIRLLAHSILKIEQGRMEMLKDSERLRAELEIKKGEMELKRTEIIANSQLQIAKIFMKRASGGSNGNQGSPFRTEFDMLSRREGKGE